MDASYIPIAEARGFTTHWLNGTKTPGSLDHFRGFSYQIRITGSSNPVFFLLLKVFQYSLHNNIKSGRASIFASSTAFYLNSPQKIFILEQSCDLTALVYVDLGCCRYFRKTWHGHDLTCQCNNKSCTCRNLKISYCYLEICRSTKLCLVVC